MSSSLNIFRRNQKAILVFVTLMAIFAFVFLDPLMRYVGGGAAPANPVVVETKYGKLRESEIQYLIEDRQLVDNFIQLLAAASIDKLLDQGQLDPRSREMYVKMFVNEWRQRLLQRSKGTPEAIAVETMLLDEKAKQMGLVITDAAVNQVIREISLDSVSPSELAKMIPRLRSSQRGGVSEQHLFDAFRKELAAWRVMQSFEVSANAMPPAQRWDYFQRLNRKAVIEAVAVKVADFTAKVPDPSQQELETFFDKYKNSFAVAGSPEPGFKQPRREKFQYLKAESDLFREKAEVTDEEVLKYYEANKNTMFRKQELPAMEPKDSKPETPADAEAKPAETKPSDDPEPATDAKPEEPKSEDQKEEAKPEAKSDEKKEDDKSAGLNLSPRRGKARFMLVSDEKEKPAEDPETNKSDAPEAKEPAAKEAAETSKPKEEAPADSKDDKENSDKEAAKAPTAEQPAATIKPSFEPLEKVKEQIIQTLKNEKANQKIVEAIQEVTGLMRAFSDARSEYLVNLETNPQAQPPKPLDFVAIAKKYNLVYEETKLASAAEIHAAPGIGQSYVRVQGEMPYQYRSAPFVEIAFGQNRILYSSVFTEDNDGNGYVSWKIEETKEAVPTFEAAHDEVLQSWKMIQARDLARKQAELYAAEVNKAKTTLAKQFEGDKALKAIEAGPFSWLTLGTTPEQGQQISRPVLSDVDGVESAGEAFMQATFSLEPGQAGVAMNYPEDICYVIQVQKFEPETSMLEADFAKADLRRYMGAAMYDTRNLYTHWIADLEQDADVKWLREPREMDRN